MKLKVIIFFLLSIYCIFAHAIPARKSIIAVRQPDGSVINIRKAGDGKLHYTLSEDGNILILDKDGFYKNAAIDTLGNLISTGCLPGEAKEINSEASEDALSMLLYLRERRLDTAEIPQSGLGLYKKGYPTEGSPRIPVILVEYSDIKFGEEIGNPYDVHQYFSDLLTGESGVVYNDKGSVSQYFNDQSKGKFTPIFDIYGPVTLPNPRAYYGGNYGQGWDVFAGKMVTDAVSILDSTVDFSVYDEDHDGDVDMVYIFYAGLGEHDKGDENTVWPHSGFLKQTGNFKIADGVFLNGYACSNETDGTMLAGMSAFVHEYLHVIGLPDLYTVDTSTVERDFTPGQYSILDYGVYNDNGRTPPNLTSYERNALKWDAPLIIDGPMTVHMEEISTGEFALISTENPNEFFLLENRQLTGWDEFLPNHGMLVWHIDYDKNLFENNQVNIDPSHQHVDLVEANNTPGFVKFAEGFPFPGSSGNTSFTPLTTPALQTWKGETIDLPITNIDDTSGILTFDVAGGGNTVKVNVLFYGEEEPAYYNLQGIQVSNPTHGVFLKKTKGSISKILIP